MYRWMRTSRRSASIAEPPSLALRPNYNRLLSGCAAAVAAAPRSPKLPNPDGGFSGKSRTSIRQGSQCWLRFLRPHEAKMFRLSGLRERPRYLLEATGLLHFFDEVTSQEPEVNIRGWKTIQVPTE
jgi:hypothetical protein